jgi:hypothetical protein
LPLPRTRLSRFHLLPQAVDDFLEHPAAVFIILELVKARTRRSQEHNISGIGSFEGFSNRRFKVTGVNQFNRARKFFGNSIGGTADEENVTHTSFKQRPERGVRGTLVLPPQDEMDTAIESLQGLHGSVNAGCLGIVVKLHPANFLHKFQPMLDAFEFPHRLAQRLEIRPQHTGSRCSRQNVL